MCRKKYLFKQGEEMMQRYYLASVKWSPPFGAQKEDKPLSEISFSPFLGSPPKP